VKRLLGITLGILTAIGGFVDIGDLVANPLVGARYGLGLAWAVVVGVVGIGAARLLSIAARPVTPVRPQPPSCGS
jgi:manganese transport protein